MDAARNDLQTKKQEITEAIQMDVQTFQLQADRIGYLQKTFESNRNYLLSSERQFLAGRRSWQEVMNTAREEAQILAQIADAQAQVWLAHQHLQIQSMGLDRYLSTSPNAQ